MDNLTKISLPWKIDAGIARLWVERMADEAFGDAFLAMPDSAGLLGGSSTFLFKAVGDAVGSIDRGSLEFGFWLAEGGRFFERQGGRSMMDGAENFLFRAAGSAFGGDRARGDAEGPLERPGLPAGFDTTVDKIKNQLSFIWMAARGARPFPSALMDLATLCEVGRASSHVFGSTALAEKYGAGKMIPWSGLVGWEKAVQKHWAGRVPSAGEALSAALPFCALGAKVPSLVAARLGVAGKERAIEVAVMHANAAAAGGLAWGMDPGRIEAASLRGWSRLDKSLGDVASQANGSQDAAEASARLAASASLREVLALRASVAEASIQPPTAPRRGL